MSNSKATASEPGVVTPVRLVFAIAAAFAFPVVYGLVEHLGTITYPALFVGIPVTFLPPFFYHAYWPRDYDLPRAAGWGLAVSALVAAQLVGLVLLAAPTLGPDGSVFAAFVTVVLVDYAAVKAVLG
ncbi:hypothetical protein [Halorientalis halophila]|uniref:hypothetical protein n=1 Tax=Halorientalis halophila TaxID=3108499 RepID=UPI00300A14E2